MRDSQQTYDELLVLKCQEADPDAFDELLSSWQRRLWHHAWRLVGNENAAWDILQNSLLAIIGGIGRLTSPAAFGTWAYRIVTNKSRDWIRRESRHRDVRESYGSEVTQGQSTETAGERILCLREAVMRLPGGDRALLALKYEDGFDIGEIASILDVPPGTVKSRLYHARQRLKKMMEDADHEP